MLDLVLNLCYTIFCSGGGDSEKEMVAWLSR